MDDWVTNALKVQKEKEEEVRNDRLCLHPLAACPCSKITCCTNEFMQTSFFVLFFGALLETSRVGRRGGRGGSAIA